MYKVINKLGKSGHGLYQMAMKSETHFPFSLEGIILPTFSCVPAKGKVVLGSDR